MIPGRLIIGIDPGPHTGIAVRTRDGNVGTYMIHNNTPRVWEMILAAKPDVIVVERFATSGRISVDGLKTVEIMGSMFSLAWMVNAQLVIQSPSQRSPFLQAAKAQVAQGASKLVSHQFDALAHVLAVEYRFEHDMLPYIGTQRGGTDAVVEPGSGQEA